MKMLTESSSVFSLTKHNFCGLVYNKTMEDVKNIVKGVIKEGFEFEIYFSENEKTKIDIEDKVLDRIESSIEVGLGIRAIKDGKMGFSYTTVLSKKNIEDCVKIAMDIAMSQETSEDIELLKEQKIQNRLIELYDDKGLSEDRSNKIKKLVELEDNIKSFSSKIKLVRDLSYTESKYHYIMENSYGVRVEETLSGFFLMACAIANSESDTSSGCSYTSSRFYEDLDFDKLSKDVPKNAIELLNPKSFETKTIPVVLSQDSMASLLRAFSPVFLGDFLIKNKTLLKDRVGEEIANKQVNIIDDGTINRAIGSAMFDADGNPTQKNIIIENGIFKGFLHNIYTAKKTNDKSTSSSVRGGYKSMPQTGIHNLYLEASSHSLEELLGFYDECVYITELMGLHMTDPISGNFSLGASGIYYKSGKPVHAVRAITIASNFLELLKKIKLIGNDFRFFGHVGSPSVLVENITIGGG